VQRRGTNAPSCADGPDHSVVPTPTRSDRALLAAFGRVPTKEDATDIAMEAADVTGREILVTAIKTW